jgi:hypothetical protein
VKCHFEIDKHIAAVPQIFLMSDIAQEKNHFISCIQIPFDSTFHEKLVANQRTAMPCLKILRFRHHILDIFDTNNPPLKTCYKNYYMLYVTVECTINISMS